MKPTIALFLYDPKCSVQSGNGIIRALSKHYNFKIFGINALEDNFFDDVDIIAVPGGFGDASSFKQAFKYNGKRIIEFVAEGGKYLGICMGAYWAGRHYFNILKDVDAVQYIRQPKTDTRRPHAKNISIKWKGTLTNMFWYDGCALVGDGKYKTVATYANGNAMAIIQNNIGLIGAHPESEEFWYDSYSWMKGKYHDGEHHKLLLDFVNQLMLK
jgi:putative intracellular protease/amidase